jgi:UDP-sugar transporter A1/2/3
MCFYKIFLIINFLSHFSLHPPHPRTAVMMELIKFITCLVVVARESRDISSDNDKENSNNITAMFNNLYRGIKEEVFNKPKDVLLVLIPSFVYVVQNNLLYFALSHLDAVTYQIGYQIKILTTAVFSVYMLDKKFSNLQWFSLVILMMGVAMTQLSADSNRKGGENSTSGFVAVLLAACSSGFAGVFFEKVVKSQGTSVWMQNIRMSIPSIILGFAGIYANTSDRAIVATYGFFHGYSGIVWCVIILQAIGGLVVAMVVKYADNILKGFAASFSIVTSLIFCYFWLDFHPTWIFFWGAILVNVSMYLYSYQNIIKTTKVDDASNTSDSMSSSAKSNISDDIRNSKNMNV